MTYREKYFELQKLKNKYLNPTAIKTILMDDGGYKDFYDLLRHFDDEIKDVNKVNSDVEKITSGEPLQYVLGYAYFINSNYIVSKDVLIPRQETEQLAVGVLTQIVKMFGKDSEITIVDIGTGSGVLGIYLKEYFTKSRVICTDISVKCLKISQSNAELHHVDIELKQGDMLEPILGEKDIDVIISNPPYILDESNVDPQTLKHEPHLALFANPVTKYYEEILTSIDKQLMNDKKFIIAFEIGEDMEESLTDIIETKYPGIMYRFDKDIYGKTRFLYIVKNEELTDALN